MKCLQKASVCRRHKSRHSIPLTGGSLMLQAPVSVRKWDFFFLARSAERDTKAGVTLLSSRLQVTSTNICACQSTAWLDLPHRTELWNVQNSLSAKGLALLGHSLLFLKYFWKSTWFPSPLLKYRSVFVSTCLCVHSLAKWVSFSFLALFCKGPKVTTGNISSIGSNIPRRQQRFRYNSWCWIKLWIHGRCCLLVWRRLGHNCYLQRTSRNHCGSST